MEKKRVFILVKQEAWEGIQTLLKENHISNQFFNACFNLFLEKQYEDLQEFTAKMRKKGGCSVQDQMMYQVQLINKLNSEQPPLFQH